MIAVENIIDTNDIREMAGDISANTLHRWRHREDLRFPDPITMVGSGLALYDRIEVEAWLRRHIVKGRNGASHVRYTINH